MTTEMLEKKLGGAVKKKAEMEKGIEQIKEISQGIANRMIDTVADILKEIREINVQYAELSPYAVTEDSLLRLFLIQLKINKMLGWIIKELRVLQLFIPIKEYKELLSVAQKEKEKTEDNLEDLSLCLDEDFRSQFQERLNRILPSDLLKHLKAIRTLHGL